MTPLLLSFPLDLKKSYGLKSDSTTFFAHANSRCALVSARVGADMVARKVMVAVS